MNDFLHRELSEENAEYGISVTRCRTSAGHSSIILKTKDGQITFSNEETDYGDGYEQAALSAAELLDKLANDPCYLPTTN